MSCKKCEMGEYFDNTCMKGKGSESASIMFISGAPLVEDEERGSNFSDGITERFISALSKRGIPEEELYFTSVIKCPAVDVRTNSDGPYVHEQDIEPEDKCCKICSIYLEEEISRIKPKIIIPLDNKAMKYTMGKVGITKARGKAVESDGVIYMPMLNFRFMGKRPAYKSLIQADMKTLRDLYFNGMTEIQSVDWKALNDLDEVIEELDRLQNSEYIVFDLETTGLDAFSDTSKIICIALSDKEKYGRAIPLFHRESPFDLDTLNNIIVPKLKSLLENDIEKVAHNGKFDTKWLKENLDIKVKNFKFDTQIAHYIAVSEEAGTQGLKGLAWEYTDLGGYDNALDKYRESLPEAVRYNYDNIPWSVLSEYASGDVDATARLRAIFKPMIDSNPEWSNLFYNILMPASDMLCEVESTGLMIDDALVNKYAVDYDIELQRIENLLASYPEVVEMERYYQGLYEKRVFLMKKKKSERTEEEQKFVEKSKNYQDFKFNWGSVNQLRELLFERLGLSTTYLTDKGALSTGEDALVEMSSQHELPRLMMERRKISTLKGMFVDKLPTMRRKGGFVFPTFNLTGTVTGRLSSENPNVQQIPRQAGNPDVFQFTHEIKRLFVSRFGKDGCMLNIDYSALELRVAGIIAKDKNLIDIFKSGLDLHKSVASKVFNVPFEDVDKDLRTKAKAVSFGIIYGKAGSTFGKEMWPELDYKKQKINGEKLVIDYLNGFPSLRDWIRDTKANTRKYGYAKSIFGRLRRLPNINSTERGIASDADRQCINAPIQSSGSDMTLSSMVAIQEYLNENNLKTRLVGGVHDSLIIDVYLEELPVVSRELKRIMETAHMKYIDTEMPIVADLEIGDSYGNMLETDLEECQGINSSETFANFMRKHLTKKWEGTKGENPKPGIKEHYIKDKKLSEKKVRKNFADLGWGKYIDIGDLDIN